MEARSKNIQARDVNFQGTPLKPSVLVRKHIKLLTYPHFLGFT